MKILLAGSSEYSEPARPRVGTLESGMVTIKYVTEVTFSPEKARQKGYDGKYINGATLPGELDPADSYKVEEKNVEKIGVLPDGMTVALEQYFHSGTKDDFYTYTLWVGEKDGFFRSMELGTPSECESEWFRLLAKLYVILGGFDVPIIKEVCRFVTGQISDNVEAARQPLREEISQLKQKLEDLQRKVVNMLEGRFSQEELALYNELKRRR